jgi:hypothetical protein
MENFGKLNTNFYETQAQKDFLEKKTNGVPSARDPFFEPFAEHFTVVSTAVEKEVEKAVEKEVEKAVEKEVEKEVEKQVEKETEDLEQRVQELETVLDSNIDSRPDNGTTSDFDKILNSFYILMGFSHDNPTYMPVTEFGSVMRAIIILLGVYLVIYIFASTFNIGESKKPVVDRTIGKLDWDADASYGKDNVYYGTDKGLSSSTHLFSK